MQKISMIRRRGDLKVKHTQGQKKSFPKGRSYLKNKAKNYMFEFTKKENRRIEEEKIKPVKNNTDGQQPKDFEGEA